MKCLRSPILKKMWCMTCRTLVVEDLARVKIKCLTYFEGFEVRKLSSRRRIGRRTFVAVDVLLVQSTSVPAAAVVCFLAPTFTHSRFERLFSLNPCEERMCERVQQCGCSTDIPHTGLLSSLFISFFSAAVVLSSRWKCAHENSAAANLPFIV